jgi:hypothetical protein
MPERKKSSLYLASLRLERWPRSMAIVIGFTAVFLVNPAGMHSLLTAAAFLKIILAFFLTWMVSTANYIINEITDAPFDAFHPGKKHRPLVQNKISIKVLLIGWVLLVAAALVPARERRSLPRFHPGIGEQSDSFPYRLVRAGGAISAPEPAACLVGIRQFPDGRQKGG